MKHDIDWSKSHNGVFLCSFHRAVELMPEVAPILDELKPKLELGVSEYLVDVKIHMLMKGQMPCIPNWHYDFMPRDSNGNRVEGESSNLKMYMWLSSAPLTEYKNRVTGEVTEKPPQEWHAFTQRDLHRGATSDGNVWRCFIRVIPKSFKHECTYNDGGLRRHAQVYLDSKKYRW